MAYDKQSWKVGDPITQEKMTHIEDGIGNADSTAGNALTKANAAQGTADEAKQLATQANLSISNSQTDVTLGKQAWNQIATYLTVNGGEVVGPTLGDSLRTIETNITNNATAITNLTPRVTTVESNIRNAASASSLFSTGRTTEVLAEQINDLHEAIQTNKTDIGAINRTLNPDNGSSITKRLADLDGNTEPAMTVPQIIDELVNARGVNQVGGNNINLDARLDAIDGGSNPSRTLPNVITEVESARGGYNNINDRLDKIDAVGSTDNKTHNYRITAIESEINAARNGEVNLDTRLDALDTTVNNKVAKDDIKKVLTYDVDDDTVLQARQGKILNDNINTVAAEVTNARTSSVVRTPGENEGGPDTDTTYNSLDERLEAIESNAAATATNLRTDLNTIANELAMLDNGTIVDTNTKIDNLEADVQSFAAELSMTRDENTGRLIDTNTKVDELNTRIGTAETDIDNLEAELDTAATGLKDRMTTAETTIGNLQSADTELDRRLDAIDGGSALTGDTLATRVSAAESAIQTLQDEPKSATVIISVSDFESLEANEANSTKDYLVGPDNDNLYKYYHIIEVSEGVYEKVLISGGGSGTGSSSGAFASALTDITNPDINTDYFVGNNTDGYLHYRYIAQENSENLQPVLIGINPNKLVDPNNIKRYNIERVLGKKREYNTETQTWVETDEDVYYLNLYEFDYGMPNAQSNIEESMVPIGQIELPQGGGGSGTITTTPRVVRITPSNVTTVQNEEKIYLRFFYAAVDATGESIDSTYTLKYNNGSIINSGSLNSGAYDQTVTTGVWPDAPRPIGFYEIDITDYCRLGTQTFNLTVTVNGQDIPRAWTINILELRLDSSAPDSQVIEVGDTFQLPYTPYGAMAKTLYVAVDGTTVATRNLSSAVSGSELEIAIPSQAHGAHRVSFYLKAILDGVEISTVPIIRDYIWYDESIDSIILASPYRDEDITVEQYDELKIPYTVYNSNSATSLVKYYIGNELIDTVTVGTSGIFNYTFEEYGEQTVSIVVDDISLSFNVTITETPVDIAPVSGAIINFDPSTLSNNSVNRLPSWTYNNETYHMTVSDNFNWSNDVSGGGYKEDVDGKCFVIKAGTYAEFDYKMFKQKVDNSDPSNPIYTSSVFDKGSELKIIFKVASVRDASAVWFSNVGNPSSSNPMPIGIQLSAHQGWLKTSAADAAEKQAQLENTTVSTNSYLYFPYSEEDKIELDISINRSGNNEDFIMSYEDGVPSKAYKYETTEILYHEAGKESIIRIGSPNCDVYIYKLRIYDKGLNTSDILRNFIADGKTINDKVNRYNRNSIYYDSTKPEGQKFTPYKTGSAVLDPEKLAERMPDVKVLMLEAPTFTKSKKTFVKSSLRCIHAPGGTVYPSRGDEDNWLFQNGYHSGQGTTSDNYGQASRNVDFLFECDGTNRPSDKVEAEAGYVSTLIKGANKTTFNPTTKSWVPTIDAEVETCSNWKGDDAKVSLTSTSIPNNYFNLKVNVASSENVNNALFQKRYNDFLPYISPAKTRDSRIKNDMEFVPAVLFIRETDTTQDENGNYTKHLEFNDTEWHFYSLGNIGDSKKTDYTRAYDPTDENEFTVEISDNNTSNSQFQSGVYMSNNERVVEEYDTGTLNSMNYIWDITDEEWNAQREPTEKELDHDYRVENEIKKYDDGTDVENNLTKYILPNGKVYVNYRHRMLSGDPFDGDHTFEFRYASCGDYRDGKIVNPANKEDARYKKNKAQEKLNRGIIEAFYEWIIRASNNDFAEELAEWCVPESLEYFYAFTHFYTMMDNRAKNTFWHFAKTGTPRIVHHPYAALLHVYTELKDGEYVPTEDTEIDPNKTYYTEYAFDLWAYDMDTAAGIDNNGELIFPYGKEDTDYRQAGVASSGYVFNGAGSIIWRRLSQSFTSEIADIFDRVNEASCFDAANLITQFDNFQNCYPEEMWRLDIERKYIRTFTGKVYDNCKLTDDGGNTKQNTRFLKEMMQGRKKYQRRQWVRDQGIYFGSKYMLSNVRNNTIEMVCYTPDAPIWNSNGYAYLENDVTKYRPFAVGDFVFYGDNISRKLYKCTVANSDTTFDSNKWVESVTPNYKLKITPYQDMYINVAVGNGNLRTPQRAVAGQEYTIDCTSSMNETRVYIYAGSYIQAISGLAPFYIGANIFSSAARLKKLDLGTDNSTYHNTNLKGLTLLPNMPLLEELNIKNCDNLNTPINLSESNNLKIVEAEGSIIPSLSLPAYTSIETLHLPSTVNVLILQSARKLNDFYMKNKTTGLEDYSSLINLNINDSDYSANINWIDIALSALPHLDTLYLRNLNTATIQDIIELEPFASRKKELETQYDDDGNLINKLNLTGYINISGDWSKVEAQNYANTTNVQTYDSETGEYNTTQTITSTNGIWSDLTLNARGTEQTKWPVTYRYNDKEMTIYVANNDPAPDIYSTGLIDMPVQASTPEYRYIFGSRNDRTGAYVPYSGWHLLNNITALSSAPIVQGPMTLEAHFNGQKRQYYIRWLLDEGRVVRTIDTPIDYGSGYSEVAPTIQDIHDAHFETCSITLNNGQVTYDIFKGWDKLPTNITPDGTTDYYDIYAEWEHGETSLVELFSNIENLSPAQLYVLSELNINQRSLYTNDKIDLGLQMNYQLGHDYDNSVVPIVSDKEDPLYLDGTNAYNTLEQPLLSNSDAFTFAIDYRFDDVNYSSKSFATLISCYHSANNVKSGFGLFKNISSGCIEVGFGDIYGNSNERVAISSSLTASTRNILVIRHMANDPYLHIYSGLDGSGSLYHTYDNNPSINGLYYTAVQRIGQINFNSDAYLNIGQVIDQTKESVQGSDTVLTTVANAQGTIYWAKLWKEDLGEGECRALAAWPHEYMAVGLGYLRDAKDQNSIYRASQDNNIPNPTLQLASLNVLEHGAVTQSRINGSSFTDYSYGWTDSIVKNILERRLLLGLPVELQAILCKSNILYQTANYINDPQEGWKMSSSRSLLQTRGYITAYSAANVLADGSEYEQEDPYMSPLPWKINTMTDVFNYNGQTWVQQSVGNAQYLNIRFPYKPISFGVDENKLHVFVRTTSDISSPSNVASSIGAARLRSGDIFIDITTPYIYVSNKEINKYGLYIETDKSNLTGLPDNSVVNIDSNNEGRGGWIKAEPYWTRSVINDTMRAIFCDVRPDGTVNTNTLNNNVTNKLSYIIAI